MNEKYWSYAVILNSFVRVPFCVGTMAFFFRERHAIQLENYSSVQWIQECPAPRLESG